MHTVDLAGGERLPDGVLADLENPEVIKAAYNAQFERVCLSKYLGHWLDPRQWRCTAVMAAYLTMPARLADAAVALGVTERKMEEGKDLIRYFSVPCKPTKANDGRTRNLPEHAPDKWAVYKQYNAQDVETERAVRKACEAHPMPESEWELYALDQMINDRGVRVDKLLVKQAMAVDSQFSEAAYQRAREITGLDNPGSVAQLKAWLADQDVPMESLAKKLVQEKAANTEGVVSELLSLRLELSKTSIKKYETIARCVCRDGRVHGMLQYYGASRTGRWAGRLLQVQNLPQNHLEDLDLAGSIVKAGDTEQLEMLFGSVPNTLSELIRTALIPRDGCRFIVADFSAIEARVLAWQAGEEWVLEEFRSAGKIYEATASRMYHVPKESIVKGNPNYEYRQKGKQATLSCIAEGELVLTNRGLIPIEQVTLNDMVWDGEQWVHHEGVVYRGERSVITYQGLTATEDHLVWIEGQPWPVHFGFAAASGAHLVQTGDGWMPIRLGRDYFSGEAMVREVESMLCPDQVCIVRGHSMDVSWKPSSRSLEGMPELFRISEANSHVVGSQAHRRKREMRESQGPTVSLIWWTRNRIQIPIRHQGRDLDFRERSECQSRIRVGPHRYQRSLRSRQHQICFSKGECVESTLYSSLRMGSGILALFPKCGDEDALSRKDTRRYNSFSREGGSGETKELENHQRTARLYDIRNAGPHHRFTVSGHLVHNCGYGGGVGALKNMGAKMPEDEMQPLVDAWREANPHIVALWGAMDRGVRKVIRDHSSVRVGKVVLYWRDEKLLIRLPTGRDLCYLSPRTVTNRFGNYGIGYLAPMANGQLGVLETFGGKLVENCTQAIARDLLAHAMLNLEAHGYRIVFHVHDECVMEMPFGTGSVEEACAIMGETPEWCSDLPLRADGYECASYRKG